ncbi:hypothetical protein L210DRAFT_2647039 [Boletus edulis BED1]|uniref:Uncharacterized protein n=1 Tax=Boletus edulis BED1 TaxID=1328754 RepID=A0AAD4C520_BOLED|nr:hypothetical protein L210DRAFT_2647039 [Boletus edulis BED1]
MDQSSTRGNYESVLEFSKPVSSKYFRIQLDTPEMSTARSHGQHKAQLNDYETQNSIHRPGRQKMAPDEIRRY